ncbi:MAG: YifB family Mg chelatase-like AAA ATPase [Lachnospiraceae bacterium]|nr:YifB family Mg chelatase-like AAA ATPase [Lachnospiraceae bacterium]
MYLFSVVISASIYGVGSRLVRVEADVSRGIPCFQMVGMLNSEVREARERVRVALKNAEIELEPMSINVNLSPADLRKEGTAFDLPIAIAVLIAYGYVRQECVENSLIVGELGLNGEVRAVKGILSIVQEARKQGIQKCIVPRENALEGAVIHGIDIVGVSHIREIVEYLKVDRTKQLEKIPVTRVNPQELMQLGRKQMLLDFAEVNGQDSTKRAAEIAAAGFHHMLMIGPPGSGKTMIANRIATILPPMMVDESIEVSTIYSVAGMLPSENSFVVNRPFLNPHHTITQQALIGGGRVPSPGVVSLAHRGVLFLDELPEFKRENLDLLRQPLEDKQVQIARNNGTYIFPSDFMLVGAMNPCPCGYFPDRQKCNCAPYEIGRYLGRISGPILDRIDICVETPSVNLEEMSKQTIVSSENSAMIRKRVLSAREIQKDRFKGTGLQFNSEIGSREIQKYCAVKAKNQKLLFRALEQKNITLRGYYKILKVARTIADIDGAEQIEERHLMEALYYRKTDEKYWKGNW